MNILTQIHTLVFTCLPPFLMAAGIYFCVRLGGFPLRGGRRILSCLKGTGKASRRALFLSLAGTLGVGNIAGVGVALAVGGAGAVFWLFVGGAVATVLKYAEVTLALGAKPAGRESRGALDYITPTLGRRVATVFALLALFLSLTMGSLLQGGVIAEVMLSLAGWRPIAVGLLLSGLTLPLFLGGRRAIERLASLLIPALTLLYCGGALLILLLRADTLPAVLARIAREAFSLRSAGGGLAGIGIARAMRAGISKGLFSNEAGAGTAPFAHGHAEAPPAVQGVFGILEVAIDTLLMCTLSALSVLCVFDPLPPLSGTTLVAAAFGEVFGAGAGELVSLSVTLFAFATVACWVSYGQTALSHLSPRPALRPLYALLFCALLTVGATVGEGDGFLLSDILLGLMSFINLTALLKSTDRIRSLSAEGGLLP